MNAYLLGIDLGTTNVKALLYDIKGRCAGESFASYPLHHPQEGWAEQNANDWWGAVVQVIRRVLVHAKGEVLAICVSSQAPTMLPLDENGAPLRPGIIWMDIRAQENCEALIRNHADYLVRYGGQTSPYYLLPKVLWFRENEPELFRRTRHIVTTNGYINFCLTGEVCWDTLQADQLTQCFDTGKQAWSDEAKERFGVDFSELCHMPRQPWEIIGRIHAAAAYQTGLSAGVPVLCGTADGIVALLASGVTRQGDMGLEIGTSAMILMACRKVEEGNCRLMHAVQGFPLRDVPYVLSSSVNTAGKSMEWLAEILEESKPKKVALEKMNLLAEQSIPGSRGLMFMPYLAGERAPLWEAKLRGSFYGLSLRTARGDMVRAVLEGVAFGILDSMEEAKKAQVAVECCYVSGGGAQSRLWLQIIASTLNVPLKASHQKSGAPLADVILAGYALRLYPCLEDAVAKFTHFDEEIFPLSEETEVYRTLYGRYKAIQSLMLSLC